MIDFLCIGAQKAGTTWLMANLSKHPGVWTPRFAKELHYFDVVHFKLRKLWVLKGYQERAKKLLGNDQLDRSYFEKVVKRNFAFTDPWYEHVFSPAPQSAKRGECTPHYCALDELGVEHVARCAPEVRIIYIIREPLDRMKSSLHMSVKRGVASDEEDFKKLLHDDRFLGRGDYMSNIPRWEKQFSREQILYIPFGDIRNNPQHVMQQVEAHIGLPPFDAYPKLTSKVHRTKEKAVTFSDELVNQMRSVCEPQNDFLVRHFGEEFVSHVK